MSDTPDLPQESSDEAADHPAVPDLLLSDEVTDDGAADPSAEPTDSGQGGAAAPSAGSDSTAGAGSGAESGPGSKDTQRLMIAIAILVFVAVAAIGVGIARKGSESANTTATNTATTTASTAPSTTAPGGKATTTKPGTPSTKPGATETTAQPAGGGCRNGTWPASFTAPPDAEVLKQSGVHVWNQNPGWKLRVIDPAGNVYAGEIVADFAIDPAAFKTTGAAKVTAAGNKATFEITGSAEAAGIEFQLPCAVNQFTIGFTSKGGIVSPDVITVGKDSKAISNPIVVNKVRT